MALSGNIDTNAATGSGYNGYLRFSWSATQDIVNNKSTVSWNVKIMGGDGVTVHNVNVYINGARVGGKGQDSATYYFPSQGKNTICSGTTVINHNTNGVGSFSFSMNGGLVQWAANMSVSTTVTLDTIKRASDVSCGSLTLGSGTAITITKNDTSYTHNLSYSINSGSAVSITTGITGTSYTWTPPLSLAANYPNSASGYIDIICETFSGSTSLGSKTIQVQVNVPASVIPSISSVSATPSSSNATVNGWGVAVAGYSKIVITANAATYGSNTGSSISGFVISGQYSATTIGTSLNYTDGAVINNAGTYAFNVQSKDARGRLSAVTTKTITVYEYSNPVITNFKAVRDATTPTTVTVNYAATISSCNGKNSIKSVQYQYKASNSSSWSSLANLTDGAVLTGFTATQSYDFKIRVTDQLNNVSEQTITLSTMSVVLDFRAGGKGLGIGKVAEADQLQVGMDAVFNGTVNGYDLNAVMGRLTVQNGTLITAGSDLNNIAYLKPGVYYCNDGNVGKTIANNPTGSAFFMETIAPIQSVIGNEATGTWTYRVQRVMNLNGKQYIRGVNSGSTAGSYTFGSWSTVAFTGDLSSYLTLNSLTDYIVAKGVSGKWTYRKWNSGIGECFLDGWNNPENNYPITTASWANGYESQYINAPQYPFDFIDTPSVTISCGTTDSSSTQGDVMIIRSMSAGDATGTSNRKQFPPPIKLWRGTSRTLGRPSMNYYAIGHWK